MSITLLFPKESYGCAPTVDPLRDDPLSVTSSYDRTTPVYPPQCLVCKALYKPNCNGRLAACSCTCPTAAHAFFSVVASDQVCSATYKCPSKTRAILYSSGTSSMQPEGVHPVLKCSESEGVWMDSAGMTYDGLTCADQCVFCPSASLYKENCNGLAVSVCNSRAMVTIVHNRDDVAGGCSLELTCPAGSSAYYFAQGDSAKAVVYMSPMFTCKDSVGLYATDTNVIVEGMTCGVCVSCPSPYVGNCNGEARSVCATSSESDVAITRDDSNSQCVLTFTCSGGTQAYYYTPGDSTPMAYTGTQFICRDPPYGEWMTDELPPVNIEAFTCMSDY
ncbi:unnamed protein product [Caenorhabditis auriculariae]|uniref:Uncharacterized protein n=1 Tax=Caenorhabditis auriculariae TaxID=2777116 RepID=A0A8S1GR34_9PELO|nr:unnamed protein product [Caenorhabditis auriculariae]